MSLDRSSEAKESAKVFRTQQLAEIAGTTPRALRHYHQIGLLPDVQRDANGYRRYSIQDLIRVLRIRQLAMSGMALRDIGAVLDLDAQRQDHMLAELDRELAAQSERIEIQREILSELRDAAARPAWVSSAEPPTATEQLDKDVWTLVTASSGVDAQTVSTIRTVRTMLNDSAILEAAAAWYPEFERLETCTQVEDQLADRLAAQIADFVALLHDTVLATAQFSSTNQEVPLMVLVDMLQFDTFSLAQQEVWKRFLALIHEQ